jgi:hypothetical protein
MDDDSDGGDMNILFIDDIDLEAVLMGEFVIRLGTYPLFLNSTSRDDHDEREE